jgi:hypothetical protein
VLVGVHDIYLPDDYEAAIASRHYSEQYMLAAYLLGGGERVRPVLPAMYVSRASHFAADLVELWAGPEFASVERHRGAFWFTLRPRNPASSSGTLVFGKRWHPDDLA